MLYAISIKPLARAIAEDHLIQGIQSPGRLEYKLALYVDDVNVIATVCRVLAHLNEYEGASGARVNKSKSSIWTTSPKLSVKGAEDFCRGAGMVKVLGIYMGADVDVCAALVWAEQLVWCRAKLQMWKHRVMGLKGSVGGECYIDS